MCIPQWDHLEVYTDKNKLVSWKRLEGNTVSQGIILDDTLHNDSLKNNANIHLREQFIRNSNFRVQG